MKRTFYKTWGLLHFTEQNELIECEREYYEETYGKDYTEQELEDYVREMHEDRFTDDFGEKYSNLSCSDLNNNEFEIQGVLGLWNGKHKIIPERIKTLTRAIQRCFGDDTLEFAIGEDAYGNLWVSTYHHDGQNLFTIKKVTDKGLRCVNFSKEVLGC